MIRTVGVMTTPPQLSHSVYKYKPNGERVGPLRSLGDAHHLSGNGGLQSSVSLSAPMPYDLNPIEICERATPIRTVAIVPHGGRGGSARSIPGVHTFRKGRVPVRTEICPEI